MPRGVRKAGPTTRKVRMRALAVHDLTYAYGGSANALTRVSLTIEQASIVGLIGPNGSGKSTLIKNVFDLLKLQHGSIHVAGHAHDSPAAKAAAAYLASNDHLPDFLSPREYVTMMSRLHGEEPDHEHAAELFDRFSMTGRYDDLIEKFSHGMRKKTQIVAGLTNPRTLTVIDETLNGIDLDAQQIVEAELRDLRSAGHAVLLCSHDFAMLERVADRIVFLDYGIVVQDAPTAELVDAHGSLSDMTYRYLASDGR